MNVRHRLHQCESHVRTADRTLGKTFACDKHHLRLIASGFNMLGAVQTGMGHRFAGSERVAIGLSGSAHNRHGACAHLLMREAMSTPNPRGREPHVTAEVIGNFE